MYNLSIVIPGIRVENWERIVSEITKSCGSVTHEIIFCSPKELPENLKLIPNIRHILDFGSPSRCLQRACTSGMGEYVCIMSDDARVYEGSLEAAYNQITGSTTKDTDILAIRYTEGVNFVANPNDFSPDYWQAYYHRDLRLPGIDPSWKICLMFMMQMQRFKFLGGIDCRFEHFNMNLHDLAFRNQRDGGNILISNIIITAQDWEPSRGVHNSPIIQAYYHNDAPLFHSIYSTAVGSSTRPISIDINNWKDQPERWPRRYG